MLGRARVVAAGRRRRRGDLLEPGELRLNTELPLQTIECDLECCKEASQDSASLPTPFAQSHRVSNFLRADTIILQVRKVRVGLPADQIF